MGRGKCIKCRIANSREEARRHPNAYTLFIAKWLSANMYRFMHTILNCRVRVNPPEESEPVYEHRPPKFAQQEVVQP